MALIKKQKTEVLKRLTVRIEEGLLARLAEYSEYLESSKDYVISEAVRYIIDRDKEFLTGENLPQNSPQLLPQILPQNPPQNPPQSSHQDPHQISHQAPERRGSAK